MKTLYSSWRTSESFLTREKSRQPFRTIHILLSVIDNLGDMGFACELIRSFHEIFSEQYHFVIWTDAFEKTEQFFEKNRDHIAPYCIREKKDFSLDPWEVLLLLFHHALPENLPHHILVLRIDYLSFDPKWVPYHGHEHIESSPQRKIIEIIPSPLPCGWWLISPTRYFMDRDYLAERFWLRREKKWGSIFVYEKTLEQVLSLEGSTDTEILLFGNHHTSLRSSIENQQQTHENTLKHMPFVSLLEFSSLIHESAWTIIRGEVSFISTLQIGTPFLWDMYKQKWGFSHEQAHDFLAWYAPDEEYRNLFWWLNEHSSNMPRVKISELEAYFSHHSRAMPKKIKNLVGEVKKYIDTFYYSL